MPIHCPTCQSPRVVKFGRTTTGIQRYQCRNHACKTSTFLLDYAYTGCRLNHVPTGMPLAKTKKAPPAFYAKDAKERILGARPLEV